MSGEKDLWLPEPEAPEGSEALETSEGAGRDEPVAYEESWYRALKALSDRRAEQDAGLPFSDEGALDDTEDLSPLEVPDDMSTAAALEALDAIGAIRGPGAVDALVGALGDPEPVVRHRAVELLGRLRDPRANEALERTSLGDPVPQVRRAARQAIGSAGAGG